MMYGIYIYIEHNIKMAGMMRKIIGGRKTIDDEY